MRHEATRSVRKCQNARRRRDSSAFTIVELLIVIGIIAVLIAILLPALHRARQQAGQIACMSNLRQLGIIYSLYANDNGGQIPLGYSNGRPWTGYILHDTGGFPIAGRIYKAGLLKQSPRAFYCPSQRDARWQFNTPTNVWPAEGTTPPVGNQIRVGYTSRPSVQWSGAASPGDLKPIGPYTKLFNLKSQAILADIIGIPKNSPDYTNVHHRSLNVLYSDISVHSIERGVYDPIQKLIEPYPPTTSGGPPYSLYIDATNPAANALWNVFDRN